MNCDAARRRLFADEDADRPSDDEARRHLAACATCRAAARRLAQIERQLPHLPVPPSSAKAAFVRRFVRTGGPVVRHIPVSWPTPPKERGLRKLSLAVAIAAMLAVVTIGLWSWPHLAPPPVHSESPGVAKVQRERERIHKLPPQQQIGEFMTLVSDLRARVRDLTQAGDADELTRLAVVYGDVLKKDLLPCADGLPAAQRPAALANIATELDRANSEFARLAAEKKNSPEREPLERLAAAAAESGRDVQNLLRPA